MELKTLTEAALDAVYHERMKEDFPSSELKPLSSIKEMIRAGVYEPMGLYDGEELLGYAFLWQGERVVLLDYLAVSPRRRNGGLGATILTYLKERYLPHKAFFVESEGPLEGEDNTMRLRRLEFYRRNGFGELGYNAWVFNVFYRILGIGAEGLQDDYAALYRDNIPAEIYKKMVFIPYEPGEDTGKEAAK